MQEAERMFARAAATNPGSPYVFLAWGQMRGVACADVAGARAVFNRGAELCPRCAAFTAPSARQPLPFFPVSARADAFAHGEPHRHGSGSYSAPSAEILELICNFPS